MPARVSYEVGRLDRLLRRALGSALEAHGLSLPEYTALSVLRQRSGSSNAELARRSLVAPQSMNEVVSRLETRRLVRRAPNAGHGRTRGVELTSSGMQTLRAADASVDQIEHEMLKELSAAECRALADLLASAFHSLRRLA